MKVNKVVFNGNTIIDITDTVFDPMTLPQGSVAYNAAGERIEGQAIVYNVYTDTTAMWNQKTGYVPQQGDIIVYSDKGQIVNDQGETVDVPGIKIGDGNAYVVDLPFVGSDDSSQILTELRAHTSNTAIHVTPEEKHFWNNKINCDVNDGNLILSRL